MAVTLASLELLGKAYSYNNCLNIVVKSLDCICFVSFKNMGASGLAFAISFFTTH